MQVRDKVCLVYYSLKPIAQNADAVEIYIENIQIAAEFTGTCDVDSFAHLTVDTICVLLLRRFILLLHI